MLRWGELLFAGLVVVALAGSARAQMPSPGSTGMNFVPIDTTRNLAAPIPVVPMAPRKSLLSRTYTSVKSLVPFTKKSLPMAPIAQRPTNVLPTQSPGLLSTISNLTSLKPKVSDVVSGSAK